jgi:predicted short-subunit dehydrogenase-like oxidoreductase (DUF2520 family)
LLVLGRIKERVAIIGCGIVGTAIGKLLARAGYPITGVTTRTLETAKEAGRVIGAGRFSDTPWDISKGAQVVFITTPDDAIASTCEAIASHKGLTTGAVVMHCSGALASGVLSAARRCGAVVASLHPLQSFASVDQAERLVPGSFCAVEGDDEALPVVRKLVKDLGGILMEMTPEGKTLYHAAAVVASNYLVTLMHLALELNRMAGVASSQAFEALQPLIKGTLSNIDARGIPEALTGPIARGDVETVMGHLEAMRQQAPKLLALYRILGLYTVGLATEKGTLGKDRAERLMALLGKE